MTADPPARPPEPPRRILTERTSRLRRIGSAGRLASLHAAVLALVLGAVVVALVRNFSVSYEAAAASAIAGQLRAYEQAASARPPTETLRAFSARFLRTHPIGAGNAVIVSLAGGDRVVTGRYGPLLADPRVRRWLTTPPPSTRSFAATVGGQPVEVVGAPLVDGGHAVGTYIAASDLSAYAAERAHVVALSLAEAAVALVVGVASAFFLLRRLLRTVGRVTETAEQIGSGALERRLGDEGPYATDEVGELTRTFDVMLDRLETAMTAQRRLLADVSHQLRTPLTIARGHLEVLGRTGAEDEAAVRETLELVIDELDHMGGLVERLLMLGRAMEPDLLDLEAVDLGPLLFDVHDAALVLAPHRVALGPVPDLLVRADPKMLRGAVLNLVDNAVRATTTDQAIAIGARLEPGGGVRLSVEDAGPGIPAAEREAALRRFARPGARDEGGSGLGLAIAKAVALAHGGSIEIDQSPALGGARVSLLLPPTSVLPSGGAGWDGSSWDGAGWDGDGAGDGDRNGRTAGDGDGGA